MFALNVCRGDYTVMTSRIEKLQIIPLQSTTKGILQVLAFLEIYPTKNSLLRINI